MCFISTSISLGTIGCNGPLYLNNSSCHLKAEWRQFLSVPVTSHNSCTGYLSPESFENIFFNQNNCFRKSLQVFITTTCQLFKFLITLKAPINQGFQRKFSFFLLDFPFKLKCFKIVPVQTYCYFILLEKASRILNMLD